LPPDDPAENAALIQSQLPDPAKRPWEHSLTGYVNWAATELVGGRNELARMKIDALDAGSKVSGSATAAKAIQDTAERNLDAMDES
jgi:hypothetical protein